MILSEEILIIGGGPAAQSAAAAYRESGGEGNVTMLAGEGELPYERPPLSKDFLRGESHRSDLAIEDDRWYRDQRINVVRGSRATALDLEDNVATTHNGSRLDFDRCLLATGARPLKPDLPGIDCGGVRELRTIGDSERLAVLTRSQVLVVGSGFIGCEAAASLSMLEADVTIATLETSPQVDRLGKEASVKITGWLVDELGMALLPGAELDRIDMPEGTCVAEFRDGRRRPAGGILIALGIERNTELAAGAGVDVDDGVLVGSNMVSSNPKLLAAGDVAFARNETADRRLKVEHWGEALNQGEIAGKTLAGVEASWSNVPGFWSTIGEHTLKYAGWGDGWDSCRFETGADGAFTAWYGKDGDLVGVLAHEADEDYERGKKLIESGASWK